MILGLTGKTGAGKSTVAAMLEKRGFFVIDGDKAARVVTRKGAPLLGVLAENFGSDIIDENGELRRRLLADRAFATEEDTALLSALTHTEIDKVIRERILFARSLGYENILIDAAALLESPSASLCDRIAVVTAPEDVRLERILARDGITREQALRRMRAQKDDSYYLKAADCVIRNYPPYDPEEEIKALF